MTRNRNRNFSKSDGTVKNRIKHCIKVMRIRNLCDGKAWIRTRMEVKCRIRIRQRLWLWIALWYDYGYGWPYQTLAFPGIPLLSPGLLSLAIQVFILLVHFYPNSWLINPPATNCLIIHQYCEYSHEEPLVKSLYKKRLIWWDSTQQVWISRYRYPAVFSELGKRYWYWIEAK